MKKISVDIISDIACPWCYVGRQRLQKALDYFANEHEIVIQWKPFDLFPHIPTNGIERKQHMISVFGSEAKMNAVFEDVSLNAKKEGLVLHFDKIPVSMNTFPLHRLIWKAKAWGQQDAVATILFDGFFAKGINMSVTQNIIHLMEGIGWQAQYTQAFLESNEGVEEVQETALFYKSLGISNVPFYIINNSIAISGAQQPEVFIETIRKALYKELQPL